MITAEQIEKIRKSGLVAIAGVSVSDILDSLDACETERDRLRTEVARLSAHVVEVPELTEEECEEILRSFPASLPAWEDGNWSLAFAKVVELVRARLVPTHPKPAPNAQAHNGEEPVCDCACHTTKGIMHFVACCGPGTGKQATGQRGEG